MTVTATSSRNVSTAAAGATVFPYGFKITDASHLLVLVDDVPKTLGTHYTVDGVGLDAGGDVTFLAPLVGGEIVVRMRNMPYSRTTDFQNLGDLLSATLNNDQDAPVLMIQQLAEAIGRCLQIGATSPAGTDGELPLLQPLAPLVVNADGTGFSMGDPLGTGDMLLRGDLASSDGAKGAALVKALALGIGAVARSVQDKLRDSVSVKDFGAKGDGTTDDAAAFNAALAAAAATPNRRLYVPSGTYRLASAITAVTGQGVFMHGDGVVPVVGSTGNGVNTRGAGSWIWFDHAGAGLTLGSSGTLSLEKLGFVRTQTTPTDVSFAPIETGYDIDFAGNDLFIRDVVLLNPTYGVYNRGGGRIWIDGLLGQPLKVGLRVDANTDTSRIQNVHWWPFWTNQNGVRVYQKLNADAFLIYRMDNPTFDSCFCIGFAHMFNFQNNANGQFNKVRLSNCDCDLGSSFIVIDSACASGSLYVTNCVTQGSTSDYLTDFHNISIGGSNATVFLNNTTLNVAQGASVRVSGTGNRVFLTNVAVNNWNQSAKTYSAISVATSGNKVYSKNAPISLWTAATTPTTGAVSGSTLSFEEFAGYFSSDGGTTSKRLPDGWTVSRLGAGNYSLVHNLGLAALDDMSFSLNCDNATSGAIAQIDRTNSGTANVRIRTYVGTTATDCGIFFTARPVRT